MPLPALREAVEHLESAVVYGSVAIALVGLAAAAYFFRDLARAEAMRSRFAALHRVLSGKYFVDEAYDRFLSRPLTWVSSAVFLRLGDRILLDGSLNGMARLARRTAGVLGRVQTGNLQLYLLLALGGLIASLWWIAQHV